MYFFSLCSHLHQSFSKQDLFKASHLYTSIFQRIWGPFFDDFGLFFRGFGGGEFFKVIFFVIRLSQKFLGKTLCHCLGIRNTRLGVISGVLAPQSSG